MVWFRVLVSLPVGGLAVGLWLGGSGVQGALGLLSLFSLVGSSGLRVAVL